MVIEDMQQSLELLENIKYFFYNIEEIEKKLNIDLRNKEYERDDLLHEIELSKLNAIEIMAVYKKLEKVLQERRIIKDKIDLVSTIKPYANKFIAKGICAETDAAIKNIETLKRNQEKEKAEKENKDESQQMLSWFQIIMLIGRPLWDKTRKKWRVLNGYQAVLGNTNNLFYEVTFTDTPYWENYADKQLYLSVPVEKEKQKESGDKGSNNKDK